MSESTIIDKNNKIKFYCVGESRQLQKKTYHKIDMANVCISTAKNKKNKTTTHLVKARCPDTGNTMCRIVSKPDYDILKTDEGVKRCTTAFLSP
jgi:hypothetical protein